MLRSIANTLAISAGAAVASAGTIVFSNSNGVSFGVNGQTVTASAVGGGAFSAGASNLGNTAGNTGLVGSQLVFVGTNNITLSGSTNGGSATISISGGAGAAGNTGYVSAGGATASFGTVVWSNSNGVSFGVNGQTVTGSVATSLTNVNVSAGAASNNLSALVFGNSNNVSFGLNGSTITATATVAAQTNQTVGVYGSSQTTGSASSGTHDARSLSIIGAGIVSVGNHSTSAGGTTTGIVISATQSNQNVTAQNGGFAFQTLSFSNANGVSFGTSAGSAITASYTVPSVTNSSWTVSDSATSATVGRLAFTASNGLTLSLSTSNNGNHTVIGSYTVPTLTNSSMSVSDAATSGTLARLAFTNLNGVTLSLSTGAGGSHTIVGSHNALTSQSTQYLALTLGGNTAGTTTFNASNNVTLFLNGGNNVTLSGNGSTVTISAANQTNQAGGVYGVGNTSGTSSGTYDARTLSLSGAGAVTVAASNSGWIVNAPVQTNQSVGLYATSNTTQGTSGTQDARSLTFAGAGIASVGVTNGSVVISVPSGGGAGDGGVFGGVSNLGNTAGSTGTVSTGNLVFVGTNALTLSQSTGAAGSAATITFSVPQTSSLSATGWAQVSTNGSTISIGATATANFYAAGNTFGTSSGTGDVQTVSISGDGGVQVAASNSGWVVRVPFISYWRNAAAELIAQTQTLSVQGSVSYVQPMVLDAPVSANYMRFLNSLGVTNTTSIATSANATGSCSIFSTLWAMLYVQNTGASSMSLRSVASASAGITQVWSLSANTTGSQWTMSQSITHPVTGGTSQFTTGVTTSLSNYSLGSLSLTAFTGLQHLDLPFASSLLQSNYWLVFGASSTTSTGGIAAMSNLRMSNSMVAVSQVNSAIPYMGQATANSVQLQPGIGSFSTNAIGTTASLGFSNVTSSASHPLLPLQLIRFA